MYVLFHRPISDLSVKTNLEKVIPKIFLEFTIEDFKIRKIVRSTTLY